MIPSDSEITLYVFDPYIHCNFHTTGLPTSFAYILHYCLNNMLIDGPSNLQTYPVQRQSPGIDSKEMEEFNAIKSE
jgi:hypothetical protein